MFIHDDVIIATEDTERHEAVLQQVLNIIQEVGMTLNISKCMFHRDEVPYWWVLVNKHGIRPDPEKVKALKHASPLSDKQELISFLCMVQSNRDLIPFVVRKSAHFRELTKKGKHVRSSKQCQREFKELRDASFESMLMNHFNPNTNMFILVDAHRSGLSATLTQGDRMD